MPYSPENIPPQLLSTSFYDIDQNIIIGENGSGKSLLLNDISTFFLQQDMEVIAIANSIYDKFKSRKKKFYALKASYGKRLAYKVVVDTFKRLANEDLKRIRNVATTLEYVGYDPLIHLRINGLDENFEDKAHRSELNPDLKEILQFFFNRFINDEFTNDTLSINFNTKNFEDLQNSFILQIFQYESELKKLKLIKGIEIFLSKNSQKIPLNSASSGELTLISSLMFITAVITDTSVLLIDEPENSLHPKWQIEYLKKIDELFYLFQPKIIVATHSPLIINGAEVYNKNVKIFKGENRNFTLWRKEKINVEEIYQEYFDITTPENRYLSECIVEKMNLLAEKKIGRDEFREFIFSLNDSSYDTKQKKLLDEVLEMGDQILNEI